MVRSAFITFTLLLSGLTSLGGEEFEGEIRRIGRASVNLSSSTTLEAGDLLQIHKGSYNFSLGQTKIEIGESSLVSIGQKKAYLEIFRGSANISCATDSFILLNGSSQLKLLPNSSAYWASKGEKVHISLFRGKGHLLTPSEGKVLTSGMGALIEKDQITSNILALNMEEAVSPMTEKGVQKIFEETAEFRERFGSLGFLEAFRFEDPKEVIFYYLDAMERSGWINHVERGQDHLLAQKVLLLEKSDSVFPERLQIHLRRNPSTISLLKDFDRLDVGLSKMDELDRVFISFFVRQAMAEELIAKKKLRLSVKGFYRTQALHQTNVTESPDDSKTISDRRGASMTHQLQVKWTGLTHKWGQPGFSLRLSDRSYYDGFFTNREVSTLGIESKLNRTVGKKGDTILEVNPSYKLRFDFVNSNAGRDLNFFTHRPALEIVFNPIQEGGRWSDLFFHFLKFGLDHRKYASGFRFSSNAGEKKDTTTLWTSWIGINAIRWGQFRVQESLSVDVRSSISEDANLEYNLYSLNLSLSMRQDRWEAKPLFSLTYREQPAFRGAPRNDLKHELGVLVTSYKVGNWADISLGYRYSSQNSNQDNFFDYIDQQWSMSLIKAF